MNLRRLRHFVAVADERSFSRAAERLALSQPALSLSLRELENELGVELLDRQPGGISMTAHGEVLYTHARALLRDAETARQAVTGLEFHHRRELHFGSGPTLSSTRLATAMQRCARRDPLLRFNAISGVYAELLPRLRSGELDFIISRLPLERSDPDVVHRHLFDDAQIIICSPSHPLASAGQIRLERLLEFPWVYSDAFETIIPNWGEPFRRRRLTPPQPSLHANSYPLVRAIIESGNALTVMPSQLAEDDLRSGRLRRLDVGAVPWRQRSGITVRRGQRAEPAVDELIAELEIAFSARETRSGRRSPRSKRRSTTTDSAP
ncbi:MAG: LysR family transcriptional regulator [Gammaproteobacteria bacterium]|nr:LysR family transcriptional regulator [Gammaproteobacteria bacterium]